MVMLIHEGYFNKNILPLLKRSAGDLTEAHSLFRLSAANNEVMLVSRYFEADVTLLGFTIPHVGFLVVKDPNTLLEPQHSTQLPGVIGCNLIRLGCEEFGRVYGFKAFEEFHCPSNIHPVVFPRCALSIIRVSYQNQLKLRLQAKQHLAQLTSTPARINAEVEETNPGQESVLGQVWVGNTCQAICIPANSVKVMQGRTNKITRWLSCMVEARVCHNLPRGIVVNRTMVTPCKNKQVPVALMNTNTYNVWICQPLLVADIVEAEDCPWDYQSSMSRDGNKINISFCPVPSTEVQAEIVAVSVTKAEPGKKLEMTNEGGERPKFGSRPDFNNQKFDFKKELSWLPFPVNMGEVEMTESQQKRFIKLIYDHQSVFSLCDEDLGLCDHLKHTIPTTTDKPIYLPHHTILVQLQAEVCKCLDTWLKQGIIWPSRSLYALQVVIVHKKTGDIHLCMDFRALNAITICDSFPLPQIEEALQAVKAAVWFTSFDLAQGYLTIGYE